MNFKHLCIFFGLSAVAISCVAQSTTDISTPLDSKEAYLKARQNLVSQDYQDHFAQDVTLDSLEQRLNSKLIQLREAMTQRYKEQHFFPPARHFTQSKSHIENTDLFKILREMPKGGILHLHGAASGDAPWIVDKVLSTPNAYVYWDTPKERHVKGEIRFFNKNEAPPGFSPASQLSTTVAGFADSLQHMLTFDEAIAGDSVDIWGEFEQVFNRIYGFISYQPMFVPYFKRAFKNLTDDRIQHAELRGIFNQLYDLEHDSGYYNADSTIQYFQQAVAEVQKEVPAFTLKIIYTDLRFRDIQSTLKQLVTAFELRKRYPNFLIGYDLVAEEDAGHSTLYFLDNWLRLDSLAGIYGVDMPLYLHDGESNWVSIENLYDAVLLDSKRIGHGFNLFRFPNLIEEVKRKDICLEVNPISNQILGYVSDLRNHPAATLLRRGVPCVISSDDPLIFDYKGLTYDFWEVFLAWELDLPSLKKLASNSLQYSGLSPEEKQVAMAHFDSEWHTFVTKALNDY